MVQELRLFKYVNGINDMPFPNNESNDEQIVITSFAYNAQRMAVTPTITAIVEYPRCLDNDWDNNVYAEYNGEKYYIRQIPSSSKSNTSVMYKHDITLYSERFVLENIYFTDIEKKTENGVDTLVKKEATSIIYRFNLLEYVERLNWSLEVSKLPYRVVIDSSVENLEKAQETKDIFLEHAYLASAIQEIYTQWEIPFYFEGTNIVVKDCSENIAEVLEYGAENSLLSIKKNNANFRKITRISGYGSDKNIPFYYPNWSQKGIIDAMPLSTNSKLTKSMLTITDMKKFDKKMPLNGKVEWIIAKDYANKFSYNKNWNVTKNINLGSHSERYLFHTNAPYGFIEVTIPIAIKQTFEIGIPSKYDASMWQEYDENLAYSWDEIAKRCAATFDIPTAQFATHGFATVINASVIEEKPSVTNVSIYNDITIGRRRVEVFRYGLYTFTALTSSTDKVTSLLNDEFPRSYYVYMFPKLSINENVQAEINYGTITLKGIGTNNKDQKITKNVIAQTMGNTSIVIGYGKSNLDGYQSEDINIVYSVTQNSTNGWYLNETKKINLADIGISVNGTPDDSWNGEGFTQEMVSKIPTAQNLMPSLYRNSIGERKFYNAINYPRSAGSNDQDGESGETLNGLMYENENYKDNGEYYNFETLWTKVNQNEHIQEFSEIFPSITNVTNANNDPIDEILDVWFDDNDNNEVDEEGKFIHPYFYVRIPQFSGNNGFNLFDHKIVGEEMQVAMTSGDCAACNFKIMVKTRVSEGNETYEDVINPIKTQDVMGKRVPISGNREEKTSGDFGSEDNTQQDSRNGSIWLVLEKDNQTFNETYPNYAKGVYPKVGDKFVLLNIDMPRSYVLDAEEKLTKEVIKYMSQNNSDKWNFDIDFSRIFLQENVSFYERLDENCKLNVRYNGEIYNFYVNNYKYEVKANEALPKIMVGLVDTITINRGVTQNIVDSVIKAFNQMFEIVDDPEETIKEGYLRKNTPEIMPNNMSFNKDVNIDGELNAKKIITKEIASPLYGGNENMGVGFKLEEDENGNSTLTVDNVNVRKKLKATEYVIQQIKFQGGIVIQSAAAMECNRVVKTPQGNYTCFFDTKNGSVSNQFVKGDLARCQRAGYAPKYYWREVTAVGTDYIILSNAEGKHESGSDTPSEGDIIVQMGNTSDVNRQSAIEMTTVGENAPSFIMYSGINSFSLENKNITGIVYHQQVVDENGNVTLEAYPELYSYGSMYFGDRAKENNFIQFQPNANGIYEMLINAKTTFKGDDVYLSEALNSLSTNIDSIGGFNEARTNILKDTAIVNVVGINNTTYKAYTLSNGLLTTPIKAHTEYVFSVERTIVNSATTTPTEFTVMIWHASGVYDTYTLPINAKGVEYINILTTDKVTSNSQVFVYAGLSGSTEGNNITFVGLKLAEGNKYTGYEATPSEKDAIMSLQSAIKGATDIIGGLVMTNMIGLNDTDSNVTAGISGLSNWDKLRFWAGANWQDAPIAPFRVYNDGRVFGTHFYGFEPALEINNDNYDIYAPNGTLNVDIVGSKVLLNFSGNILGTSNVKYISLPNNERYIGAEIEIFNPSGLPINLCSLIPEYPTVTVDNFYTNNITNNANYYYYQGKKWAYIKKTCSTDDYKTYKYIKLKCMPTQMILKTNDTALITITNALPNRSVGGYTQFYLWTIEKCIE